MMKFSLEEFKQGVNPYGISYSAMTKGRTVIVDIPVSPSENVEVIGIITKDLWESSPCCVASQIQMNMQRNHLDTHSFSKGLYAIYPEKIKEIIK